MNKLFIFSIFLLAITLFPCSSFAAPEGQLCWVVEEHPAEFFLHNNTDTYNGAVAAINYACQQSAGTGTYSGVVRILESSVNFPAKKAGHCRNTRPFFPGAFDGNLYTAYLYCNGTKRENEMDDSPCETLAPPFENLKNLGDHCQTEQ